MPKLRLAMIARDEADRIGVMAQHLDGIIDSVHILLDDRTTDDTVIAADDAWGDLPGGLTIDIEPFGDFGQFRNRSLELARPGLNTTDYLLLLDPDSLPGGELPASEELVEPVYGCEWRYGGAIWYRVILLRADAPAVYDGAVHEVLNTVGNPMVVFKDVWVDAVVSANAERLEWIEQILRRDAAINPRSAFYLANTLRDLKRYDEAFGWYMRRAAMGEGWVEETYCATLEAGQLLNAYDYELAAELWRRCIHIRQRAEAPYHLAKQANARGHYSEALAWASLGLQIGASTDQLFVNRWIEQEGLMQQFNAAVQGLVPEGMLAPAAEMTATVESTNG